MQKSVACFKPRHTSLVNTGVESGFRLRYSGMDEGAFSRCVVLWYGCLCNLKLKLWVREVIWQSLISYMGWDKIANGKRYGE